MRYRSPTAAAAKLGNRGYLEEMFRSMWPAPNQVVVGRGAAASSARVVEEFTVLPSLDRPRLVAPRGPRRAAVASVSLHQPASMAGRLRHDGLAVLFRAGVGQSLGTRVRVVAEPGQAAESITTHLREVLGREVHPTFRVGPARANRKPVLRLLDEAGQTVGFAKIGISDLTSSLVRTEASALADVKRLHPRTFTAPEVLHYGQWRGLEVLVQSSLPLAAAGPVSAEDRSAAILEIATSNAPVVELDLGTSAYWHRLNALVSSSDDRFSTALAEALCRLTGRLAGTRLPFGAWHGDWAPWNMAMGQRSLLVWDWERYEPDVPLGFDALHFYFQKVKSTQSPADAIRDVNAAAAALLAPFGIARHLASSIMVLYAATLASRYARDYASMGDRTWKFQGSGKLQPLTDFVSTWSDSS